MKWLLLLLLIYFISFVNAAEMGVFPAEIEMDGNTGEGICKNFSIFAEEGNFIVEDYWSIKRSRELRDYNLNAENFRISVERDEIINVNGNAERELCINAAKAGKYYGVLLFGEQNSNVGVGIWIEAGIKGEDRGEIIGLKREIKDEDIAGILIMGEGFFLSIVLLFFFVSMYVSKVRKIRGENA